MRYFAKFNTNGERESSIVEGIHFEVGDNGEILPPIPPRFVEITEDEQAIYSTNGYVRGTDGKPEKRPPPVYVPVVPAVVTMRQARLALLNAGLLANVNTLIAAMPGATGEAARIEWEYAQTVERASPLIVSLASALGLNDESLDTLFTQAKAL